jgi:predicted DNA-binding ribbon-helix-helix protein
MDDDRDDLILEGRLAGRSVPAIARQHHCAIAEVEAIINRRLNFALDNDMRLKAIKLDVTRLEALMAPFFERATKDRDVAAGTLVVKILERRALLLGLDSPVRIDVTQVEAQEAPTRHEKIKAALLALK